MIAERNFQADVEIDRLALDKEAEELPSIYLYWSEKSADQKACVDDLKDQGSQIIADVELEIREGAEKKPTEAEIKSRVETDPRVIQWKRDFNRAQRDLATYVGVVRAMEHKKSQLENLRHLWIAGYYSDPSRPGKSEALADATRKGLNRRKNHNPEEEN